MMAQCWTSYFKRISYVVTLLAIWLTSGSTQEFVENEYCALRETLVPLDSPSFRIFPYYITLHRCGGSAGGVSPRLVYCGAKQTEEITIRVQDVSNYSTKDIKVLNHTSCAEICVDTKEMCDPEYQIWNERSCGCDCKYDTAPPGGCPPAFRWNKYLCKCECDSVPNALKCILQKREWSDEKCGCSCPERIINRCRISNKDLDEFNCVCVDKQAKVGAQKSQTGCISKELVFAIILGELFLVLCAVEICLYSKNLGLINCLLRKRRLQKQHITYSPDATNEEPKSPTNHDKTTYL